MKTRFLRVGRSAIALVLAAVLPGCLGGSEQPVANVGEKSVAQPVPAVATPAAESAPPEEAPPKLEVTLPKLSPGLAEVIRLAQAQVGESVVLAYIDKSTLAFNPTVEEILYLHDVGISEPVLTAILNRSKQQADLLAKLAEAQVAMTNSAVARKAEVPALNPAPSITVPSAPVEPVAAPAQAQVVVQPVVYTQPVVISQPVFYNELSPYGTWIEVGGYGRCWQPTVAVVDLSWRPYHQRGRWLDTDAGWYWQSDYSWGWAPFHYGRWHQDRSCGWVWVPGNTWAPAWVSWRYSNNYCGWAPLPPAAGYGLGVGFSYHSTRVGANFEFGLSSSHYTFVPIDRFCDSNPYRHYVPVARAGTIYQQTTIVNNYVVGNNNTIINHGVDRRSVVAASRSEIRKVSVREGNAEHAAHTRPDRLVKEGDSLAIFRPQSAPLNAPAPATTTGRPERASLPQPVNPAGAGTAGTPGARRDAVAARPEPRPNESRALTVPNNSPATPSVVNTPAAPSAPLIPQVSAQSRILTVPSTRRFEERKDAREQNASRPQTASQFTPPINPGGAAVPPVPANFQAPKISGPTTPPQPIAIPAPAPANTQPIRPRSNLSESFSRPEIQRPAPPVQRSFQAPAPAGPVIQQPAPAPRSITPPQNFSAPAPSIAQPSRPQFNPPAPAAPSQPAFVQPSRPAVVVPPPANPGPSRPQVAPQSGPQSAPQPSRHGNDQPNRPERPKS